MLALEVGADAAGTPTVGYAATAAAVNGTTTEDLSLEAWINPKSLPVAGEVAAIISQWNTNNAAGANSFRLYLDGDQRGALVFEVSSVIGSANATESFDLGLIPTVDDWVHIALTFDSGSSKAVGFYRNGVLSRSAISITDTNEGVNAASEPFAVGAQQDTTVWQDGFYGAISDVRVWDDVRTEDEILANFQIRLTDTTNLVVNWLLDRESGGLAGTTAVVTPSGTGTASAAFVGTGVRYAPAPSNYFRPFSTDFCPAGTVVDPYQCDFRTPSAAGLAESVTIPASLLSVYAKVWGAGGGGYDTNDDSAGGSGGFSEGSIESINAITIAGQSVNIYAGGFGTGSTQSDDGAGGGAGSGIL